jgi:hypothetical protein
LRIWLYFATSGLQSHFARCCSDCISSPAIW